MCVPNGGNTGRMNEEKQAGEGCSGQRKNGPGLSDPGPFSSGPAKN